MLGGMAAAQKFHGFKIFNLATLLTDINARNAMSKDKICELVDEDGVFLDVKT